MKNKILTSLLLLFCVSGFSQVPPILHNRYTTNTDSATINGGNLTNLNFNAANVNLSNSYVQIMSMISNAPTQPANGPFMIGLVSTHSGSSLWTNSTGAWTWVDQSGVVKQMHIGDAFCASNNPSFTDQHRILSFPSASVAYTWEVAGTSYAAPGVNAAVIANYVAIFDTVPRPVAFISDDGAFGVAGDGAVGNSGGIFLGGGTNWWELHDFDDSSGYALAIKSSFPNSGAVVHIYHGAPISALDVTVSGVVATRYGFGSKAITTPLQITGTGITNTWTNNGMAYVTGGAFTNFNNAGTAILTNVNTVTNFQVPLQPGGSVTAASGLSGRVNPF